MGYNCCVVNCKNTRNNNKDVKFYKFPTAKHKLQQRYQWIAAVKRLNPDGSMWLPKPSDAICSAHFINNKKAEEELSPSYVPKLFPSVYRVKVKNETAMKTRHERFMKRRTFHLPQIERRNVKKRHEVSLDERKSDGSMNVKVELEYLEHEKQFCDQACEAFFLVESNESSKTFVCNRYIYKDTPSACDVEIQTDIFEPSGPVKIPNRKRWKDVGCNTERKTVVDKSVGPDVEKEESKTRHFSGINCVKSKSRRK